MQRKKKIETYDAESFAAVPQTSQGAYLSSSTAAGEQPRAFTRPVLSSPSPVQG